MVGFHKLELGLQPVLVLIFPLHTLNALASARVVYFKPPVDEWNSPAGGSKDRALRQTWVALQNRRFVFRPLAFLKRECDEDLLSLVITLHGRRDLRFVEAVGIEQVFHAFHGLRQIFVLIGSAE